MQNKITRYPFIGEAGLKGWDSASRSATRHGTRGQSRKGMESKKEREKDGGRVKINVEK